VVTTRIGSVGEMIADGETGALAQPRDPSSLADAVTRLFRARGELNKMRARCRTAFETAYSALPGHDRLMHIYDEAMACRATTSEG
jgi:glycosyltransferase involved in cell wall biosynthesis